MMEDFIKFKMSEERTCLEEKATDMERALSLADHIA